MGTRICGIQVFFSICEKRAGDQARLAAIIVKAFGHFFFPDHQHLQLLSLWPNIANTGFNMFWSFLLIDTLNMHMINLPGISPSVGAWSKCSRTCGGGVQFRRVADKMENRSCNNQECHKEPCLRGNSEQEDTVMYLFSVFSKGLSSCLNSLLPS